MAGVTLRSGHKVVPVSGRTKELCDMFKGRAKEQVMLMPGGWVMNDSFTLFADRCYDFQWHDDDVIVSTYPKSGTTWMQEIVWTIRHNANLDNKAADNPLASRSGVLEADFVIHHTEKPKALERAITNLCPGFDVNEGLLMKVVEISPRPRTVKCHLALPFLKPDILDKVKIVHVIRDPRDVCMSYFHHCRIFEYENFTGNLDEFIEAFIGSGLFWGPYWDHVKSFWEKRDHPNLFITYYEQLKNNSQAEYKRLAKFLGHDLTDEQIDKIVHYTSFNEMKKRGDHVIAKDDTEQVMATDIMEKEGGFFRKGVSGGWKESLNEAQRNRLEKWMKEMCPDKEIMKYFPF